jgi:hypothetical protein
MMICRMIFWMRLKHEGIVGYAFFTLPILRLLSMGLM